jgi:uncharacterized protein (DUF2147 family)
MQTMTQCHTVFTPMRTAGSGCAVAGNCAISFPPPVRPKEKGEMMMNVLPTGTLALATFGISLSMSLAADLSGTWLTEGGTATVRLTSCGGAVCGTIIALKQPNDPDTGKPQTDRNNADANLRNRRVIGIQIVLGMKPSGGANRWSGRVYNAEDGETYTGNITMQTPNTLKLEGCVLGGMICKGQTWTRVN